MKNKIKKILLYTLALSLSMNLLSADTKKNNKDTLTPKNKITIKNTVKAFKGFTWKNLTEINAKVLVPDKWFYRHENKNGEAYFISKEVVKTDADVFETGLTINVVTKKNVPGGDASLYASYHMSNLKNDKLKKIDVDKVEKIGPMIIYTVQYTKTDPVDGVTWTAMNQVVANTLTNTMYVIVFESSPEKWSLEWVNKGKLILDNLQLEGKK